MANSSTAAAASDEDEPLDEEQLEEYKEMLENLGDFPVRLFLASK